MCPEQQEYTAGWVAAEVDVIYNPTDRMTREQAVEWLTFDPAPTSPEDLVERDPFWRGFVDRIQRLADTGV
jgi:hypothetical protein